MHLDVVYVWRYNNICKLRKTKTTYNLKRRYFLGVLVKTSGLFGTEDSKTEERKKNA